MSEHNDGGPAFPLASDISGHTHGMSLRDWFAGQALIALGNLAPFNENGTPIAWTDLVEIRRRRAEWAYQQADAMLAAREVRS